MCIFSRAPASVRATRISAMILADGRTQFTVYANKVGLEGGVPTAMILPVPFQGVGEVKMVDMTNCKHWFQKLEASFAPLSNSRSRSTKSKALEVHRTGDYQWSWAPQLSDLSGLQNDVFQLPDDIQELLAKHYSQGFGFLVCILDAGAEYSPIAYVHPIMASGDMFVPTLHEHGHGELAPNWDHDIYLFGVKDAGGKAMAGGSSSQLCTVNDLLGVMRPPTVAFPESYPLSSCQKLSIHGKHENKDLVFAIAA